VNETQLGPDFSSDRLDGFLEEAGIDVALISSKHNVQYLLGGHRHHFFDYMDAVGVSRYLPIIVYIKGRPGEAAYIAHRNEKDGLAMRQAERPGAWPPTVLPGASGSPDAMKLAIEHLRRSDALGLRVGIESGFLPADAAFMLRYACTGPALLDAHRPLERLRAVKTPRELALLEQASDAVVDAMLAVMRSHGPGTSKRTLIESLRREEVVRGLAFEYALVTVGTGLNRAPSDEIWHENEILSLDSGGNLHGYIGDLCRMAILGEPDAELEDLLGEVDYVQQAARAAVHAGQPGQVIYDKADAALRTCAHAADLRFVAHGMGLIGHEAPRLTATGPIPYPASDAGLPLQAGMVLSIETTLPHPRRGFIKLEDTVVVTTTGGRGFGDRGRGWNRGGDEPSSREPAAPRTAMFSGIGEGLGNHHSGDAHAEARSGNVADEG
jgi:Xaa-Pro aminopeptidase